MSKGGGTEGFLWENQIWGLSNSDNSRGNEEKPRNKLQGLTSNSPAEKGKESSSVSKKRGRGGLLKKSGKGSAGDEDNKEGKTGESDHEIHIWTERERRKKMRSMFSNLHALLPQLPPKADKSTIVDEAVNYIKTLQHTLQKLQKEKLEKLQGSMTFRYEPSSIAPQKQTESRELFLADQGSSSNLAIPANIPSNIVPSVPRYPVLFQTWTSSNVVLNICGDEAQISICSPKKPGLFTTICYLLEKHNVELLSAHVSSDCHQSMYMIQVHRAIGGADQFAESVPVEEIYRQVACEIMCWVSSC